jgi:hypothetical protein
VRIPRVAVCAIPDTFLLSVIIANGERLQLIQVDFTPAIRLDKSRNFFFALGETDEKAARRKLLKQ